MGVALHSSLEAPGFSLMLCCYCLQSFNTLQHGPPIFILHQPEQVIQPVLSTVSRRRYLPCKEKEAEEFA